jgi:S-DNA-T family DNA segregation ATPase FtsK/SpoIIIE
MSTTVFRRPPRRPAPAYPAGELPLVAPPDVEQVRQSMAQLLYVLPMAAGAAAMAFMYAGRGGGPLTYAVGALFGVSMLGMMAISIGRPQSGKRAEVDDERRDYMRYLNQVRRQVRRTAAQQRAALLWHHPDPTGLWALAVGPRLWERRQGDEDFAVVRVGVGVQRLATPLSAPQHAPVEDLEPLAAGALRRFVRAHSTVPELPVAVSLRGFARLDVAGDRTTTTALVRALLAQLVTFHAPEDVQLWICCAPERRVDWEWVKWLPHAHHPTLTDAAGPLRMVGDRLEDLEEVAGATIFDRPRFAPHTPLPADEPHIVVVLDGGAVGPDAQIADEQGVLGVTLVEIQPADAPTPRTVEQLRWRLWLQASARGLSAVGVGGVEDLGRPDALADAQAEGLARQVAPVRLATGVEEEPLAADLGLTELLGLGDPEEVDPARTWRARATRERLRVPIGVDDAGLPVDLDLKESALEGMGPHGLVIGATGSGKSELLRTLVLGLAVTHSSESLNLVLVDFKGGATVRGMASLPHTAAVITNLAGDLTLVDRMRDALQGELVRRQELLRSAGNYASVRDYERARESGVPLQPLPSLLVVCDEFSELLSAKPDFIDLFVAIGRLGRSLGIHLMLASQRLEEGRLRGLDSHLSYRIALRTFSSAESRVVLGVPDAYELPPVPGSGFLKMDTSTLVRFKAAYVSGPIRARAAGPVSAAQGESVLPYTTGYVADRDAASVTPVPVDDDGALAETVLDVVVGKLEGAGPPAHRVWLPPLAEPVPLDDLLPPLGIDPARGLCPVGWEGNGQLSVPVGVVDKPFDQRREVLWAQLGGAAGHVAVVGAPQTGKSTMLRTLVTSLALTHTPEEVQVYAIDLGGGALGGLGGLPHVGGVAGRLDADRVRRTVAEVTSLLEKRERHFAEAGIDSMATYRSRRAAGAFRDERYGDVFLVIDGWGAFRQEYEALETTVLAIATRGLSYGVHLVVAATRWADVRPALRDLLGTRFELRLGDPAESEADRRKALAVPVRLRRPRADPRRFPLPRRPSAHRRRRQRRGPRRRCGAHGRCSRRGVAGRAAPPVRLLPARVDVHELPPAGDDVAPRAVPLGVRESDLGLVALDFRTDPHFLAFGDVESGKTGLLRVLLRGITERYTPDEARIILVDYRRTLLDVAEGPHMLGYAAASTALLPMMGDVRGSMQRRLPGPTVTPEQLRTRSWWSGPELFLVVDDFDLVVTQSENPVRRVGRAASAGS